MFDLEGSPFQTSQTGRVADKVALVLGGGVINRGWGIGKATSYRLASEGARVAVADINRPAAEETAAVIRAAGGEAVALKVDVTEGQQVEEAVLRTVAEFGALDILVNNVGIAITESIADISDENWDRVMNTNLRSMFLSMRAVAPHMLERKSGSIVNISSIASLLYLGIPYVSYATSKAAVNHLTRYVALDYAEDGVRANVVVPGLMKTPRIEQHLVRNYGSFEGGLQQRGQLPPMARMGEPWDIAEAVLFLASDEAKYITGTLLPVDGGMHVQGVARVGQNRPE